MDANFDMKENSKENCCKILTDVNRLRLFSSWGMESENKHGGKSSNCKTEDICYHVNSGGKMLGVFHYIRTSRHKERIACTWLNVFCYIGTRKLRRAFFFSQLHAWSGFKVKQLDIRPGYLYFNWTWCYLSQLRHILDRYKCSCELSVKL